MQHRGCPPHPHLPSLWLQWFFDAVVRINDFIEDMFTNPGPVVLEFVSEADKVITDLLFGEDFIPALHQILRLVLRLRKPPSPSQDSSSFLAISM
jgi:hypothetical protein